MLSASTSRCGHRSPSRMVRSTKPPRSSRGRPAIEPYLCAEILVKTLDQCVLVAPRVTEEEVQHRTSAPGEVDHRMAGP